MDFGAKGDGRTDDTAAIQRALDEATTAGGGAVLMPAGTYRLDGSLSVPEGVILSGVWQAPHHAQLQRGTVIEAYAGRGQEDGAPLINLAPSSGVKGVTFFYPEQRCPDVQPYPWTIQGRGMHGSVIDVTLVNAYKGIDFGTHPNELHYVRNVFGCPLKVGVHIDRCTDIGRIENVHFNPHYWMRCGADNVPAWEDLRRWLFEQCTAFEIGRSDWEFVVNTFSYGCKVGYRFFRSEAGACNGNFLGIAADWADMPLLVEQTQTPGLLITNGEFVGGTGCEAQVVVTSEHSGVVQLSNCSFWGPAERIARIAGTGFVSLAQCNFCDWDHSKRGASAIEVNGGNVIVQGCRFGKDKPQIALGADVVGALIFGNQMAGPVRIDNRSDGDVQIGLNVGGRRK